MGEKLYGTKDVAEILGIPEWRVKNFAEGSAYRLPPSQQLGKGHGSRRLYDFDGIARVAIANELVGFGFTPDAVGSAIGKVRDDEVLKISVKAQTAQSGDNWRVLVRMGHKWELKGADHFRRSLVRDEFWPGLFALNVSRLVACVQKKVDAYRSGRSKSAE